jgi:rod shape-determining protein MreD
VTAARAIAFVAATWLLMLLQAALGSLLPWHAVAPEIALLCILYIGFYGGATPTANAGLALTIGYLTDLFSGAPRGLHALTFCLVILAARGASHRLMVASTWQVLVVTLATALGHGALIVALTSSLYQGPSGVGGDGAAHALWLVPFSACATCLAAPLVFLLFRAIDRKLAPDTRMRMAL